MTNNESFTEEFNENSDVRLVINIAQQTLTLYKYDKGMTQYTVSTAKNGIGSQQDSGYDTDRFGVLIFDNGNNQRKDGCN